MGLGYSKVEPDRSSEVLVLTKCGWIHLADMPTIRPRGNASGQACGSRPLKGPSPVCQWEGDISGSRHL